MRAVLAKLAGVLDDITMRQLNYEVDEYKRAPSEVVRTFLEPRSLLLGTELISGG